MTDIELRERTEQYMILKGMIAYKKESIISAKGTCIGERYLFRWQNILKPGWKRLTFDDFIRFAERNSLEDSK